ncbi:DUF4238 domain-containing protein [Rhizobium sp.]|uniref:DUF4238 domain-containing protein n=1 Tax=Rhizobium sp. TaxID=391 RepID=UPI0039170A3F
MAFNKNQHFVPRVHLNPFTVDAKGDAINLYNLARGMVVHDAPAKNQCSRDYFYGEDPKLEDAIQTLEGAYGQCLRALIENQSSLSKLQDAIFRRFTYFQYLRTESAAKAIVSFVTEIATTKGSDIEIPPIRESIRHAVLGAMRYFSDTMRLVDDLELCIVRNETGTPFVTSDNPAVLTNKWHLYNARTKHLSYGMPNAGVILILPLTPKLLAIFYDRDIYSIKCSDRTLILRQESDALACNQLQVINCRCNLYFGDLAGETAATQAVESALKSRPSSPFSIARLIPTGECETHTYYQIVENPDIREHENVLVHVQSARPCPPLWPSFLQYRSRKSALYSGSRLGYWREYSTNYVPNTAQWRKVRF